MYWFLSVPYDKSMQEREELMGHILYTKSI